MEEMSFGESTSMIVACNRVASGDSAGASEGSSCSGGGNKQGRDHEESSAAQGKRGCHSSCASDDC